MAQRYRVEVGRFGVIYEGDSEEEARRQYAMLAGHSKRGTGFSAGEDVVLYDGDKVINEYRTKKII
jgi:hypothetical protein